MKRVFFCLAVAMLWLPPAADAGCGCGPTASYDTCGDCDDCEPRYGHCGRGPIGPLSWVFGILGASCPCGGCDRETYWGDFYSDAPDCHDPCDCQGNWTGYRSGRCTCRLGKHCARGVACDDCYGGAVAAPVASSGCTSCLSRRSAGPSGAEYASRRSPASSSDYAARAYHQAHGRSMPQYAGTRQPSRSNVAAMPSMQPKILSVTDEVVRPAAATMQAEAPRAVRR